MRDPKYNDSLALLRGYEKRAKRYTDVEQTQLLKQLLASEVAWRDHLRAAHGTAPLACVTEIDLLDVRPLFRIRQDVLVALVVKIFVGSP
jgi:hypothetical protein